MNAGSGRLRGAYGSGRVTRCVNAPDATVLEWEGA